MTGTNKAVRELGSITQFNGRSFCNQGCSYQGVDTFLCQASSYFLSFLDYKANNSVRVTDKSLAI